MSKQSDLEYESPYVFLGENNLSGYSRRIPGGIKNMHGLVWSFWRESVSCHIDTCVRSNWGNWRHCRNIDPFRFKKIPAYSQMYNLQSGIQYETTHAFRVKTSTLTHWPLGNEAVISYVQWPNILRIKWTMIQVMTGWRQTTNHYLKQNWPRFMLSPCLLCAMMSMISLEFLPTEHIMIGVRSPLSSITTNGYSTFCQ